MNEKVLITEKFKMDNIRNFKNRTNPNYYNSFRLTNSSKGEKKKKKYNSYNDFYEPNNQKQKSGKISKNYMHINDYQPKNRNFAIIRNSNDIMKYMDCENNKEMDDNYYSLLNDFEVKYTNGNTSFYLIYNDPKILSKYDNSKTLKSQQSFKFKIDELQNKNKNEEYKHNIGKISLPFCIYPNKHSYDKNIDNLNNQKEQDYFYRNNYTWNFRRIPEQEESKNNEINIIEENNNLKTKPNNIDNIDQTTSNITKENENNNNYKLQNNQSENNENQRNYTESLVPENTQKNNISSEYDNKKDESEEKEEKEKNEEKEEKEDNEEKEEKEEKEENEEKEEDNDKKENENYNGEEESNNEVEGEENIESDNNNEEKKTIESEEKKNETISTDKFSFGESDNELYNRRDLTTYGIINIIRLPKYHKKININIVRKFIDKNRNKKKFNSINPEKKKNSVEPIGNKNRINTTFNDGGSSRRRKRNKIKNIEFLREF